MKAREIGRKFWLYLLKNKLENVHFAIGETNNLLLTDVFTSLGTKNTSLIIIVFKSVLECFETGEGREAMLLPYMEGLS